MKHTPVYTVCEVDDTDRVRSEVKNLKAVLGDAADAMNYAMLEPLKSNQSAKFFVTDHHSNEEWTLTMIDPATEALELGCSVCVVWSGGALLVTRHYVEFPDG